VRPVADALITGVAITALGADPFAATLRLSPTRLRRMDRLCALALGAADAALVDAGVDGTTLAALSGPRLGVVLGTRFGCHATSCEYYRGLLAEGPRGASPRLFAYTLPSSPLGEVAIHVGAQGPAQAVVSGRQAGLEAILRAAELCTSGRADRVVAIVAEVGGGPLVTGSVVDRALAVVVERAGAVRQPAPRVRARLLGGGLAFASGQPGEADQAARRRALEDAGLPPRPLSPLPAHPGRGALDPAAALLAWLTGPPAEGAVALASAVDESGGAAALLVVAASGYGVGHSSLPGNRS